MTTPILRCVTALSFGASLAHAEAAASAPNILLIISDDHSVNALGSCEKDTLVPLPALHRLAQEGMVFDRSYCGNSISGPSRASILTGRHSHKNGFLSNSYNATFNDNQPTWPKMLKARDYQTAYFGKLHLNTKLAGFDAWEVVPGQGSYCNPDFITYDKDGKQQVHREKGYISDILTDKAIHWLDARDKEKPFALIVGHKAPHRNWIPAQRHLQQIKEHVAQLSPPATLHDDWSNRPEFLSCTEQSVASHLSNWYDSHLMIEELPFDIIKELVSVPILRKMIESGPLKGKAPADFKIEQHQPKFPVVSNIAFTELKRAEADVQEIYKEHYRQRTREFMANFQAGKYKTAQDMTEQRWRWYMEDYLGSLLAMDESVGDILDYLDQEKLTENTLVIYAGDQSFYLGEHGLYDKRWIFEESFRMPLIMRWPGHISAGVRAQAYVQNIDYAPTICTLAGADTLENMTSFDGQSMVPLFKTGEDASFKNRPLYYAFYEHPGEHNAPRHDGIRTERYTFARIWSALASKDKQAPRVEDEWLLIDNEKDPQQMRNVISDAAYQDTVTELKAQYEATRQRYKVPAESPGYKGIPSFTPSWDKP